MKSYADILAPDLARLFNLMASTGIYPVRLKFQKIIRILKAGGMKLPSNVRPISIHPVFDEVMKKLISLVNFEVPAGK